MGVSAPIVVSICSKYLSYDAGSGDWGSKMARNEIIFRGETLDTRGDSL